MAGLDFQYQVAGSLAVSAGAQYALQGCKYKDIGKYHRQAGEHFISVGPPTAMSIVGYVNVPVMIHWYVYQGLALQTWTADGLPGECQISSYGYGIYGDEG
jgi:hypothetical protein